MITDLTTIKWKKDLYYISNGVIFEIASKPLPNDSDNCGTYLIDLTELPSALRNAANGAQININKYPKSFTKHVPFIKLHFNNRGQQTDISDIDGLRIPLQYLIEEGDKVIDGAAGQSHPELYDNDYRNKFNLEVVEYIKKLAKGRKAYEADNVKFVMDKLPGWLTCDRALMSYSYAKTSLLTGKPFNQDAAMKLKDKNDFIIEYSGARLYLPGKDVFYDDPFVAGDISIWDADNVHKVLIACYVEEVMNKFALDVKSFTGNNLTREFMEDLGNMLQTTSETTPISSRGSFKMLPKIQYPTDYDGNVVESFDFIPKWTEYATIYEYDANKVDVETLTVEEIIELDKKYVEEVYLPQFKDSYYLHFESCVLLKDNLNDPNCDGTVSGTNNIFQVQWPTGKGTDTCVVMIARVGEKMDVQEIMHNFWIEDFDLLEDKAKTVLTYKEAFDAFMTTNYPKPESRQCVLRREIGPVPDVNSQYIFGNNISHYYVDSVTGEVRESNPVYEGYEDEEKKYHTIILQLTNGTTEDNIQQIVAEGEFALWMINPDEGYKAPPTVTNGSIAKMVNGQDAVLSNDVVDQDFTVICECVPEDTLEGVWPTNVSCPKCGNKMNYYDTGVVEVHYEWFANGIRTHLSGFAYKEYQFHYRKCPVCGEWEMVEYRETPSWWDDFWGTDCPFTRGDIIAKWKNNEFNGDVYKSHNFTRW